jgi:hypothetical protein
MAGTSAAGDRLGRRALNRATLARQLLLARLLAQDWPGHPPGELAWSVQYLLPLVHPPPSGVWGVGARVPLVLAEAWPGRPQPPGTAVGDVQAVLAELADLNDQPRRLTAPPRLTGTAAAR